MPGLKPVQVNISKKQEEILSDFATNAPPKSHIKVRSEIILLAARGLSNCQIKRTLGICIMRTRFWRKKFAESHTKLAKIEKDEPDKLKSAIIEILFDKTMLNGSVKYTAEQLEEIATLAYKDPTKLEKRSNHWIDQSIIVILSDLQRQILEGIVEDAPEDSPLKIRAKIILLAASGLGPTEIERKVMILKCGVLKWRDGYANNFEELARIEANEPHNLKDAITKILTTKVRINDNQKKILEELVEHLPDDSCVKFRAKIVLLSAQGLGNNVIAAKLNTPLNMVSRWRNRYADSYEKLVKTEKESLGNLRNEIEKLLNNRPVVGRPLKFSEETLLEIKALEFTDPADFGLPFKRWTAKLLRDEAIKLGIVDNISPEHLRYMLSVAAQ